MRKVKVAEWREHDITHSKDSPFYPVDVVLELQESKSSIKLLSNQGNL